MRGGADSLGKAVATPSADAATLALMTAETISASEVAAFVGLARRRLALQAGGRGAPGDLDGGESQVH